MNVKDIYTALVDAIKNRGKYNSIKIILPEYSYFRIEILNGFNKFIQDYSFEHKIISDINKGEINKGDVFINLIGDDLVVLIERIMAQNVNIGNDVGIISYNKTPLKKIVHKGITSVSKDFELKGEKAARLILENSKGQIEVPFYLTIRNSL